MSEVGIVCMAFMAIYTIIGIAFVRMLLSDGASDKKQRRCTIMLNITMKYYLKKIGYKKEYSYKRYGENRDKITVAYGGVSFQGVEMSCEVTYGRLSVIEFMFFDKNGKIHGFHNFVTGEKHYSEEIKEATDNYVYSRNQIRKRKKKVLRRR